MISSKTLLLFLFVAFGTATFGYIIVPSLFPNIVGTPALWLFTGAWSASLAVFCLILMWRMGRTPK